MTGDRDDAKARDLIALCDGARDLHGPTVPEEAVQDQVHLPVREGEPAQTLRPVAKAPAAFGVLDLVGVAEHGHAERGCDAAVVGVAVAEHDAADPAEL